MMQYKSSLDEMIKSVESRIIGKKSVIQKVFVCFLAGGHVLLEDVPGVGKTMLGKSLAHALGITFSRIQFTPDTLPGDVCGMSVYNMATGAFEVMQGPVMNNLLLADEINRTSPKTQASLLEAMEEQQVTIDGISYPLPKPFFVIATQNPINQLGTFSLPEAQLDRFMMKLSMGYPDRAEEIKMVGIYKEGIPEMTNQTKDAETKIAGIRQEVENVFIHQDVIGYIVSIIENTRDHEEILLGASPRASLALTRAAKAYAYLMNRDYVIPDDVKAIAMDVLAHRILLTPEARAGKRTQQMVMERVMNSVSVPVSCRTEKA
ncbi:MAG TPA: MoxR family ATPase [Lachnospiraceae bacterium]|nr:MoxR family ATPase [Lachnospiraceae bacterium]